jgi:hypothetical protein
MAFDPNDIYGGSRPGRVMRVDDPYGAPSPNQLLLNVTHNVLLAIATVDGGYVLSIDYGPHKLCVGAEAIETGVRAVLTHLVTKGLEK